MKTIYKYPLNPNYNSIGINGLIKVLTVESQRDDIYLYALVDTDDITHYIVLYEVYGTGHEVHSALTYFKTVKMYTDSLIFHVFIDGIYLKEEC